MENFLRQAIEWNPVVTGVIMGFLIMLPVILAIILLN